MDPKGICSPRRILNTKGILQLKRIVDAQAILCSERILHLKKILSPEGGTKRQEEEKGADSQQRAADSG